MNNADQLLVGYGKADITPATGDKIIVIGNMDGEPTHIFVCRRGS